MKRLLQRTILCLLVFALLLPCIALAEAPYELVIETVTLGESYPDIPIVEEAINAITVPAINVGVRILNVAIHQHERLIPQMINSREKVDLVMVGLTLPLTDMVTAGMLKPLDELMPLCPDIEALFGEQLEAGRLNGVLYAIPEDAYTAQAGGFVYNRQMADELGISVPDPLSFEQCSEIFETIKARLPGVYGTSFGPGDVPGIMYLHDMENYGSVSYAYGVTFLPFESRRIVNLYASQPFRNYLIQNREWMKRGYAVPDSMTSGILNQEYMAAGEIFGMTTNYSPIELPTQQALYPFPIDIVRITKPMRSTSAIQERMWGIPVTCEAPHKAMEFLNLIFADSRLANLLTYGTEGHNYKFIDDDVITYADGVDPAHPGYGRVFSRFGDQMKLWQWQDSGPDFRNELADFNAEALDSLMLGYTFDTSPVALEVAAVNEVIASWLPPLECGLVADVDAGLSEFNARLSEAGIERIIAENQRQLDAWLASG